MQINTCAWVRARLPLLAGGDSLGLDRWVVEPHLVRCDDCRRHLEALRESQATLVAAALEEPAPDPDGAPSLWPEFSRRLRQARHPRPRTAWGLQPRHPWAWPLAAGLAAGLLIAASLVTLGARHDPRIGELVNEYVALDQLLPVDAPRLLKPDDPEQFDRRRSRPRPRSDAAYRESHASALPDEARSLNPPRTRIELTQ